QNTFYCLFLTFTGINGRLWQLCIRGVINKRASAMWKCVTSGCRTGLVMAIGGRGLAARWGGAFFTIVRQVSIVRIAFDGRTVQYDSRQTIAQYFERSDSKFAWSTVSPHHCENGICKRHHVGDVCGRQHGRGVNHYPIELSPGPTQKLLQSTSADQTRW